MNGLILIYENVGGLGGIGLTCVGFRSANVELVKGESLEVREGELTMEGNQGPMKGTYPG